MKFEIKKVEKFGWEGVKGLSVTPSENISVSFIEIDGVDITLRSNKKNDRTYVLLEGAATFTVEGEEHKILQGESISIPKETRYSYKPAGKIKLIEVNEPPFSLENEVQY